ncbi:hypothetical protein PAECIP111893_04787 [Paenibacillus plantiphilus]|uniref:Uncharacterized protein n=1 Tax=Paenibacillus plantiphilus TaxID=2905650 RepID=A0ABM9CR45_9BACL|nr:hypothetical protein PAECIP111893_04787 [Paenibacillus plantiphilus]
MLGAMQGVGKVGRVGRAMQGREAAEPCADSGRHAESAGMRLTACEGKS